MITVAVLKINKTHFQYLDDLLNRLPASTKKMFLKLDQKEDRLRSATARLMLKMLLMEEGYNESVLEQIKIDKHNKPFINSEIDFNIAHSGNYVICAISRKCRVGVDIERIKKVQIDEFNIFLSKKEVIEILKNKNPNYRYFELWTQKEAIGKANGKGLGDLLEDITIKNKTAYCENLKWHLEELNIDKKYISYIAFNKPQKINLRRIKLKQLLNR